MCDIPYSIPGPTQEGGGGSNCSRHTEHSHQDIYMWDCLIPPTKCLNRPITYKSFLMLSNVKVSQPPARIYSLTLFLFLRTRLWKWKLLYHIISSLDHVDAYLILRDWCLVQMLRWLLSYTRQPVAYCVLLSYRCLTRALPCATSQVNFSRLHRCIRKDHLETVRGIRIGFLVPSHFALIASLGWVAH